MSKIKEKIRIRISRIIRLVLNSKCVMDSIDRIFQCIKDFLLLQVMKDCFKQLKSVEESVKTKKAPSENGEDTEGTEVDEEEDEADGEIKLSSLWNIKCL